MGTVPNKKDKILRITILITLLLVAGVLIYATVSYAFWQKEYGTEKENLLSSGCFSFKLTDKDSINLADAYPMSENEAMKLTPYNFTIENNCSIDMHYSITLNTTGSSDLDSSIRYKLIDSDDNVIGTDIISNLSTYTDYNNYTYTDDGGEFSIINSYILGSGSLKAAKMNDDNTKVVTAGESKTYDLYLWLDESVDKYETMNKAFEAKMLVVSKATTDISVNEHIKAIYSYNQTADVETYCITGEETTCQNIEISNSKTYTPGTIIKYAVNDTEEYYFYVLHDNGATLTLLQRENIVESVPWISKKDYVTANIDQTPCSYDSCNDEGPLTVLNALEEKTNNWKYVKKIDYNPGTTQFTSNNYNNGCDIYASDNSLVICTTNAYNISNRISRARLITMQEAMDVGCRRSAGGCPIWMYNYLNESINNGGTKDGTDVGYWSLNGYVGQVNANGLFITKLGTIGGYGTFDETIGARAVVEINK